jgi:hypothetical protein
MKEGEREGGKKEERKDGRWVPNVQICVFTNLMCLRMSGLQ